MIEINETPAVEVTSTAEVKPQVKPREHTSKGGHRCPYVKYRVKSPLGQKVNEVLYFGEVEVPQCLANILSEQDQHWQRAETFLMTNRGGSQVVTSFKG